MLQKESPPSRHSKHITQQSRSHIGTQSRCVEMSPIECYDLSIPSLAIHVTLTKVPCGQWVLSVFKCGSVVLTYVYNGYQQCSNYMQVSATNYQSLAMHRHYQTMCRSYTP